MWGELMPNPSWLGTLDRWRFLYLLLAILALLALYPYLVGDSGFLYLYDALVTAVMLFGLYAVSRTRAHFMGLGLLLLVIVPSKWANLEAHQLALELTLGALTAAFFIVMAALVLRYVFVGRTHVGDRLCGALSVYFLVGLAFAEIYRAVYTVDPTAFSFSSPIDESRLEAYFLYLSFVTQTTLGYGDITPRSIAAESLTILHASSAVLYVAVLVAWLVGSIKPLADRE